MPKPKTDKVDLIIDEFLDGPYFNKWWEKQYSKLRKKLKALRKSDKQKIRDMVEGAKKEVGEHTQIECMACRPEGYNQALEDIKKKLFE